MSPLPQYGHDIVNGDGLASYRPSPYPYGSSKGYYPNMSGWGSTYPDDSGVDYGLNYSSLQIINQDGAPMVSGYSPYSSRKSVYVDPETQTYPYGNIIHRSSVSNDGQGFSLSSMAASLPSPSDRLQSSVNRTLTSASNYRGDGLPLPYAHGKTPSANGMPEVAYGQLQPAFESPYSTTTGALASAIAHRATAHADATYPTTGTTTAEQHLYPPTDPAIRSTEDATAALSYVYSDNKHSGSRRDSHSGGNGGGGGGGGGGGVGAGPILSNGHIYVPESHTAHPAPHAYAPPGSQGRTLDEDTSSGVAGGSNANNSSNSGSGTGNSGSSSHAGGSSQRQHSDGHRRSAGSLRGG